MKNALVRGPANSNTNLKQFQKRVEEKYGVQFESYWEFHRWSVEHHLQLWEEVWDFLDIICSERFTAVMEPNKKFEEIPKWFPGARLNYAENMLRHPDQDVALILTGEERTVSERVTYGQLREEVSLLSSAFRRIGLKAGDIIACYISNRKEAVTSMLAAASIGAIFSATNPLMGVQAVVNRFSQLRPKVLFTIDRHLYNREERNVLKILPDIIEGLPTLEHVVIVPSTKDSLGRDISFVPKSVFLPDFLRKGFLPDGEIPAPNYEQLSFNHPLLVSYTSGTTGQPKGIVHSAGTALLVPLKEIILSLNLKRTDVSFTIHSTGWVTWNFYLCAMAVGSPTILYEGTPFHGSETSFWDILEEEKISFWSTIPSILEDMAKHHELLPGPERKLDSLHTITCGSCYVKPSLFDFVHEFIKSDVFFSPVFGATEFMSVMCGLNHNLPVYKTELQAPCLGIDFCCYDESGKRIEDELGELVITKPFPSMPLFFWKDEKNERYKKTYFQKFQGVWCQNDVCSVNSQTRGTVVYGRSDETLNQKGERFGSSEIYSIVNQMADIEDSLCVCRLNKEGDEDAVLFLKMKGGRPFSPELVATIRKTIEKELSNYHVPEFILEVKDIPYNMNGKRMEVLVKKILAKADKVSFDAVQNPECLQQYLDIAESFDK